MVKRVILVIPFLAILLGTFLPVVNRPALWFGLPSVLVWVLLWTLAITPLLLLYERWQGASGEGD